jgi:hypothetical protein
VAEQTDAAEQESLEHPKTARAAHEERAPAPDTWLSAWRGLRDNPLAQYLPLMLRRLEQRTSRRSLVLRIGLTLAALVAMYFMVRPSLQGSGLSLVEQRVAVATVLVLPAFAVFYFRGLFIAFQACLSALNRWPGRQRPSLLDETLRVSELSEREIILGLARLIMPVLARRVIVAAVLLQLVLLFAAYEFSGLAEFARAGAQAQLGADYAQQLAAQEAVWSMSLRTELVSAPLTLLAVISSGMLASALCGLWLLALGRRYASPAAIGSEAALLAVLQMLGSLYGLMLCVQTTMQQPTAMPNPLLGGIPAIAALAVFVAALLGLGWLALRWHSLRAILPSVFPLAFAAIAVYTPATLWMYSPANLKVQAGYALYGWFSSLCIANPLAVPMLPRVAGFSTSVAYGAERYSAYWHQEPLLIIATQLLLLPVLASYARDSVRRFRCGQ